MLSCNNSVYKSHMNFVKVSYSIFSTYIFVIKKISFSINQRYCLNGYNFYKMCFVMVVFETQFNRR